MSPRRTKSSQAEQNGLPKVGDSRLVELGAVLRAEYAEIEQEPLPKRLRAMIDTLKTAEKQVRGEN